MSTVITTGDDVALSVQLYKNNSTFNISGAANVRAMLRRGSNALTSAIDCPSTAPGANFAASLVVVQISSAITSTVADGRCDLEIEVDDNGKLTWIISDIVVRSGLIA